MLDDVLSLFHEILVDEGRSESNDYHKVIKKILKDNHLTIDELYCDLPYWIYFYIYGEGKAQNDKDHHRESCALKDFKKIFKDSKEIRFKFFEESVVNRDEYHNFKSIVNQISFEKEELKNRNLISIQEIRPGCNEFFLSIVVDVLFGTAFEIINTLFNYKRILKGDYDRINNLNFFQYRIFKQIIEFIINHLNKHNTNEIVIGLIGSSYTLTIEQLKYIFDLLNK